MAAERCAPGLAGPVSNTPPPNTFLPPRESPTLGCFPFLLAGCPLLQSQVQLLVRHDAASARHRGAPPHAAEQTNQRAMLRRRLGRDQLGAGARRNILLFADQVFFVLLFSSSELFANEDLGSV